MIVAFLLTAVLGILFIVYAVLIGYYRRGWAEIPVFTADPSGFTAFTADGRPRYTRISVLVPARNEAAGIAHCIAGLAAQSYPKDRYEVIVIDDHSADGTGDIVRATRVPGLALRCLRLADVLVSGEGVGRAYKKLAIGAGIAAAAGDLIVTTDADCRFDPGWLATLAAFYEERGAKFIAAPVRIGEPGGMGDPGARRPFSWLAVFQTLDFITLQGITGAAVGKKFHSMCNGANLAYEKKAFYEVEGFKGIDSIPSGDDMLLMHKIYRKYPDAVFFLKSPQAIVSTAAEGSWRGFINQRVRWASKADRYDDKRIFWVLLLVYILNLGLLLLAAAAFWNSRWGWLFLAGLLLKTAVEYPFVRSVAVFFGQQSLMRYFPFLQPFHIVYTVVIGGMGKFGSYRWKERKISK